MAAIDPDSLNEIMLSPRESLDIEFKEWIDPTTDEGKAKIAKACIALRNNDGGALIIGVTNDGQVEGSHPPNIKSLFHTDAIQRIVSNYSSEAFAVSVEFVEKDDVELVAILVPSGVRTPVACKAGLPGDGRLLRCHDVYVRTLNSNNTVSSSVARHGDWQRLVQFCFDNREADIGAFVRRHLSSADFSSLLGTIHHLESSRARLSGSEEAVALLDECYQRFVDRLNARNVGSVESVGTREFAFVLESAYDGTAVSKELLWQLSSAMPRHTGWIPWAVLPNAAEDLRPYVLDGGWEALLITDVLGSSVDFWRLDPKGRCYHLRGFEEDFDDLPAAGRILDFKLQVVRTAEAISVVQSIATTLGFPPDSTNVAIACRWRKLRGRRPGRMIRATDPAEQDEITTTTVLPLDVPASAVAPFVEELVNPVFALFGAAQLDQKTFESTVQQHLTQRY